MRIFKIFKTCIFWAIVGIILMPIILKLDGVIQKDFNFSIVPFAIIGVYWFVFFVIASVKSDSRKKLIFAYISVLPLCLSIGEVYGYCKDQNPTQNSNKKGCNIKSSGEYTTGYFTSDTITGYRAKENIAANSLKKNGDEVIYDVTYTTNQYGYRKTPNSNETSKKCLLFFGDSFTIGEGLNDNETLPYFLNKDLRFRVFNFGYHGYGPHQALALLKSQKVKQITKDCNEFIAFYESIPGHIARANMFSQWEKYIIYIPRFKISKNKLIWSNENKTLKNKIYNSINAIFSRIKEKSYLFQILSPKYKFKQEYNKLYFAIIKELDSILRQDFHTKLHFILWDGNHNLSEKVENLESSAIISWLKNQDFKSFLISDILPEYLINRLKYGIHICDLHPNALANELIAKFLAEQIKNKDITFHSTNHISQSQQTP